MTFTEAATAELRDRIRARIHDARLAFSRGVSGDPVIQPLLDEVEDHSSAVALLLQAERQMDEAAVYTIHGFCQRMLTQNAFESGSRFNNEFVTDEGMLKAQVVADYWRTQFYGLPLPLAQQVRLLWSDPSALLGDISRYLSGAPLKLSVEPMTGGLDKLHQQNLARIDALKQQWQSAQQDYQALIEGSGVNKRSYTKKSLPTWLAAIDAWAANPTTDYSYPDQLEKFSQQVLVEKSPKGNPPSMGRLPRLMNFGTATSLKAPILAHAIEVCREKLQLAKHRKQWLSFDDLLTQLSASMDMDEEGLLGERIRTLYPIAMIDEFQDTDPLQYSIFGRIYLDHPECGLFMIGDPKQAIYGFRGADIFTYIKARNQVSAHYTLGTNWRSSADMVLSVNQIFELPDSPFIYDSDIPFLPVNYSPSADKRHWTLEGEKQPALIYWQQQPEDDKPLSKGEYLDVMASATASEIQKILTASDNGSAELVSGDKRHAIQAGDVAVLVRTGAEGQRIQRALADQGIASVYLSNRDSVFSSSVAIDILRLLTAVLTPDDERKVKAALSSRLFDLHCLP
ncbi:exodeoxyribonuclease V beta chain [Vibrio astriarenae]|nr:exodeoxyribonuclease V beta chain [Vibrio sp. C7]